MCSENLKRAATCCRGVTRNPSRHRVHPKLGSILTSIGTRTPASTFAQPDRWIPRREPSLIFRPTDRNILTSSHQSENHSLLFPVNPLHPCLREFKVRERTEPGFAASCIEALQAEKRAEIRRLGIKADLWSGEKGDVGRVFESLMSAKGFSKWKRFFRKQSNSGLVFSGFADLRGRPFCIAVPFHFFVGYSSEEPETFEFSPVRAIPGFWFYYGFNTVDAGVLGFQAYTEIIDVMSESFD
jgi:hypothetical protein